MLLKTTNIIIILLILSVAALVVYSFTLNKDVINISDRLSRLEIVTDTTTDIGYLLDRVKSCEVLTDETRKTAEGAKELATNTALIIYNLDRRELARIQRVFDRETYIKTLEGEK